MAAGSAGEILTNDGGARDRGWGLALFSIFIVFLAMQMGNFGFTPLVAPIQKEFHMSFGAVGLFTGMGGLVGLVMSIPAGLWLKYSGERVVINVCVSVVIIGLVLVAVAHSLGMVFTGRVLWQMAFMALSPAIFGSIALNAPKQWQAVFMGIANAVGAFAATVGASLSGVLASGYGWRGGFWGFTVAMAIGLIVFASIYRRSKGRAVEAPVVDAAAPKPRSAFRTPLVWLLALLLFLSALPGTAMIFMGAPVLAAGFKLSIGQVSHIISLGFLLAIFVSLGVGWLADRTNRRLVLGAIMVIFIILTLLMTIHSLRVAETAVVIGLCLSLTVPGLVYAISGYAMEGREVGPIMGVVAFGMSAGVYLGPQIIGLVHDLTGGFTVGWYIEGFLALLAVVEIIYLEVAARKTRAGRAVSA